jgi:hypothetical protein
VKIKLVKELNGKMITFSGFTKFKTVLSMNTNLFTVNLDEHEALPNHLTNLLNLQISESSDSKKLILNFPKNETERSDLELPFDLKIEKWYFIIISFDFHLKKIFMSLVDLENYNVGSNFEIESDLSFQIEVPQNITIGTV